MNTATSTTPSEELFRSLQRTPVIAIPSLVLLIGLSFALATSWYFALSGSLPLWVATIINGVLGYGMFTLAHDGTHRTLSRIPWVNELMGQIGL